MRKCWQVFIALFLLTFLIVIFQPLAYAGSEDSSVPNDPQSYLFYIGFSLLFIFFVFWANKKSLLANHDICSSVVLFLFLLLTCWGGLKLFTGTLSQEYFKLVFPASLAILAGYYNLLQSIKTDKVKKALEYIDKWDSSELIGCRKNLLNIVDPDNTANIISLINLADYMEKSRETPSNAMAKVIAKNSNIKTDLRVISNYWEKIYILLDRDLVDKSILEEAFCSMYKTRYAPICLAFLDYLESLSQGNKEMGIHLKRLKNDLKSKLWGKKRTSIYYIMLLISIILTLVLVNAMVKCIIHSNSG
jgi:hypothetical protein